MLAVVQTPHCAIIASKLVGRKIRRWAMLDAHLCTGPLRTTKALRWSQQWWQFARMRNNYWTHLTGSDSDAEWMDASPQAVRRAGSLLLAVQDDSSGWLLVALLMALCGRELPPSRWKVLWCVDSGKWLRGGTALEPVRDLSMEERRLALQLWTAATQETPHALAQLPSSQTVGSAARHILEQLPEDESGLTVVERHLVAMATAEEREVGSLVAHTMVDFDERERLALDPHYVLARIDRLIAGGVLRLTSAGSNTWSRRVALGSLGHEVAAGQRNLVELAGISETVGGIRQPGKDGSCWFRTAGGALVNRRVGSSVE